MRGGPLALTIPWAIVALVSCSPQETVKTPEEDTPVVLAKVGDRAITKEDFEWEVERLQRSGRPVRDKEALLRELITHEALLQRARKEGIDEERSTQREVGNLLIAKLRDRVLKERLASVEVSDEEISGEYQDNIARYRKLAKDRLAVLVLKGSKQMSEEKHWELRTTMERARGKAIENPMTGGHGPSAQGFGSMAVDYSDDQASRYRGGDIGWLIAGNYEYRWPQEVPETGYSLERGEVSDVLEIKGDFYLIKKTDFVEGTVTPMEKVRSSLKRTLLARKRAEVEDRFREESVRRAGSELRLEELAASELPDSAVEITQAVSTPPSFPSVPSNTSSSR